jgi:hypothetical protein
VKRPTEALKPASHQQADFSAGWRGPVAAGRR